jgi:hypothetical protein
MALDLLRAGFEPHIGSMCVAPFSSRSRYGIKDKRDGILGKFANGSGRRGWDRDRLSP